MRVHSEKRRLELIAKRLHSKSGYADAVAVAVRMAHNNQIPAVGDRWQKSDFLKRCKEALLLVNPRAVTDRSKLPLQEQHRIDVWY